MKDNNEDQVDPAHIDGIEWDNGDATYGHKLPEIKRKDLPNEEHLEKTKNQQQINEDLINSNLSRGEDIGNRNEKNDKGIKGQNL